MGITTAQLPPSSPVIAMAFNVALDIVNLAINNASPDMYTLAVYNLAGDNLVNYAQDPAGAPNVEGSDPPAPFFQNMRTQLNVNAFVSGVIQSSGDQGTNNSMVVQEAAKNFTLSDLQSLKTPWGRQYLSIAQRYGPSIWGLN